MADVADLQRCSACRAPIRFAITAKNRKRIPLDPDPAVDGTYLLVEGERGEQIAHYWKAQDREVPPDLLYKSHFATCPDRGRTGKAATRSALQRTLFKAREGL